MNGQPKKSSPRILVVDDDPDQRMLVCEALSIYYGSEGSGNICQVDCAKACLELDVASFDVVLLDYRLPDMGGMELLAAVLERADVPVIFVTGEKDTAKAAEAIERGAMDYVVKMGDYLFAIPAVVNKCLSQHRIKLENLRLQSELKSTCEELRLKNIQLEESLQKLRAMADTDHLTGLYNRRYFAGVLNRYYNEAVRYGFDLTCCMCDLDHYKQLNDALGHQVGDEVLVMTAEIICSSLRASDIAARYGGDEMVLLLPHTSIRRGMTVAERIRHQLVVQSRSRERLNHVVTMSLGIASLEANKPTSADVLVSMADRALYVAKNHGKDQIVAFGTIAREAAKGG